MSQVKKRFGFTVKLAGNKQPRGIMVMALNYEQAVAQLKRMHPNCIIIESY